MFDEEAHLPPVSPWDPPQPKPSSPRRVMTTQTRRLLAEAQRKNAAVRRDLDSLKRDLVQNGLAHEVEDEPAFMPTRPLT